MNIGKRVRQMLGHPGFKETHPGLKKRELEKKAVAYAKSQEFRKQGNRQAAKKIIRDESN